MFKRSKPLLAGILLIAATHCAYAQYDRPRFSYGMYVGTGAKRGIFDRPRMKYSLWGEANLGMYAAFGGVNPGSMTARLHAQFTRDDIYYRVRKAEAYIMESVGVQLNPEVGIPLRNRDGAYPWELLAGIGAQYTMGYALGMQNVNGFFGGSFLDQLADSIASARRPLIPFVTAGFGFRFHRRGMLILRIRQDLQNQFESGNSVTLYSSTEAKTVNLSTLPTRLLIGCQITFGKIPEIY